MRGVASIPLPQYEHICRAFINVGMKLRVTEAVHFFPTNLYSMFLKIIPNIRICLLKYTHVKKQSVYNAATSVLYI